MIESAREILLSGLAAAALSGVCGVAVCLSGGIPVAISDAVHAAIARGAHPRRGREIRRQDLRRPARLRGPGRALRAPRRDRRRTARR